jgi:hypothetical protein
MRATIKQTKLRTLFDLTPSCDFYLIKSPRRRRERSRFAVHHSKAVHKERRADLAKLLLCKCHAKIEGELIVAYAQVLTDGQALDAQHASTDRMVADECHRGADEAK